MTASGTRLYHLEACPYCEKARLALGIERIAYRSVEVPPDDRSEVERISGQESVPVIVFPDDRVVHGSNAILFALAARPGSKLLPSARRAQILTRVLIEHADTVLAPLCRAIGRREDVDGTRLDDVELAERRRRLADELELVEGMLDGSTYLFGEHPTLADIASHAFLNRLELRAGLEIPTELVRTSEWFERLKRDARPDSRR